MRLAEDDDGEPCVRVRVELGESADGEAAGVLFAETVLMHRLWLKEHFKKK